jgi:Arm DNA-binding domain
MSVGVQPNALTTCHPWGAQKLFDGGGMYLLVQPNGGKWWRLKYRVNRKEKLISLGVYPDVSLKAARDKRDDARKQLAGGSIPASTAGPSSWPAWTGAPTVLRLWRASGFPSFRLDG